MERTNNAVKKAVIRENMWKFPTITMDDAKKISTGISALYKNETNGYLIKNFLNQDEVDYALERMSILDKDANGPFSENAGYSNPRSFSMLANQDGVDDAQLDKYFKDVKQYSDKLEHLFPFGFENRLFDFISKFEKNIPVEKPYLSQNEKKEYFTSSTVRVCYPDCGGMNTHVGNMFRFIYPKFYSFLDKLMDIEGQISYFVMLSHPDSGGELILFDALWGNFVTMDNKDKIVKANGEKVLLDELDIQPIDPKPGDLILFNGGDIWHRIANLTGTKDRITIGGFFAKNRDNNKIYGWA